MDLKKYKGIRVDKRNYLFFPPILDYNPVFAANFLSNDDLKETYRCLKEIFKAIEDGEIENYLVMNDFLNRDRKRYSWLVTFFKQIEEILEEDPMDIPHYKCVREVKLKFPPPFKIVCSKKKYRVQPFSLKLRTEDVVNKYRVLYISRCYELNDFKEGFPIWYTLKDTTVYENYNSRINKRIRIDYNNGEFLYFIAEASDNWRQIIDIPIEIDYVVNALLFRS